MSRRRVARWAAAGGLLLLIVWAVMHRDDVAVSSLEGWLTGLGPWAAPTFVLAYAVGTIAFLPGSVMTLAGGAVFGPVQGTLLSLAGATAGATAAFLVARFLGGEWVARRLGGRSERIVRGIERDGWRFVAFVRLVPLFPFNVVNYGLGLTKIGLVPYVVATALCMIPGAAGYAFMGHAGREAAEGTQTALQAALIGLALLATAMFLLPRVARRLRSGSRTR
ncbi:MAG: TVP38/TMEM64 family protein [Myxococcota bacterium]